jgi:hypothetical protein
MKPLRKALSFLAPCVVIGSILFFVYYSLVIYQPTGHLYCGPSQLAKQTDVAVHVVRQWAGKEGPTILACPDNSSN